MIADEQFEATIEQEQMKILQDLDKANGKVEEIRAICDAAGFRSNVADHDDIALTYTQLARQEEYQLALDESPSLVPQAAFEYAELVKKPPSNHTSDISQ